MGEYLKPDSSPNRGGWDSGESHEDTIADNRKQRRKEDSASEREIMRSRQIRTFAEAHQATFFPDDEFLMAISLRPTR